MPWFDIPLITMDRDADVKGTPPKHPRKPEAACALAGAVGEVHFLRRGR